MNKYLSLFSLVILSSCQDGTVAEEAVLIGTETNAAETLEQNPNIKAKNIILFIGDGMGPNQVALARFAVGGAIIDSRLKISCHRHCFKSLG